MDKKKIKVLSSGLLPVGKFLYGPILTPYYERCDEICKFISAGVNVVEVIDGVDIPLTLSNFNKDNRSSVDKPKTPAKESKKTEKAPAVDSAVIEEQPTTNEVVSGDEIAVASEDVADDTTSDTSVETNSQSYNQYGKKKNKNKYNN